MQALLSVHRDVLKDVRKLPAVRSSTREELYRRIHLARDYIAAYFHRPLTVAELARVACLSPNHFLRSYKIVFGRTPHQHITELRLEEAKRLLSQTERQVTDICLSLGFSSLGTFSWMFRRFAGCSPSEYRRKK